MQIFILPKNMQITQTKWGGGSMAYQDKPYPSEETPLQKIITAENVGLFVKTARLERGLTQKDLAGDTISERTIRRIENGKVLPNLFTFFYIIIQTRLTC